MAAGTAASDHGRVTDAADLEDSSLWDGGRYGLAMELEDTDDQLDAALTALWDAGGVERCAVKTSAPPGAWHDAALTADNLRRHGLLAGVVGLPKAKRCVCGVALDTGSHGRQRWLTFFVPVVALEFAERRSAAFSFRGGDSLLWRRPLDRWFAAVGERVYDVMPFRLGLIGREPTGLTTAARLREAAPPERWVGYLLPTEGALAYHPADR